MKSMPVRLRYLMQTISPTPHFVSFAQAVLYRGADFFVVCRRSWRWPPPAGSISLCLHRFRRVIFGGWSDAGTRPRFDVITGVSAGALIAPLAFLGPRRDHDLRDIFTKYKQSDIFSVNVLVGLLGGSALADSTPLARLIERYVDHDLLREVAEERRKGRILLIGTTNLDAERPVVWDMGRIAMSNHPRRLSLFRQVLLASAAVPGVFPPVRIQVNDGYAGYDELHVDGGIIQQVFFPPFHLTFDRTDRVPGVKPVRRLYVIRNGKISPEWQPVDEKTLSIAKRSIATLIKNQGVGDLYRIHTAAKRDGMDFNLAAIPGDLKLTSKEPFSQRQ